MEDRSIFTPSIRPSKSAGLSTTRTIDASLVDMFEGCSTTDVTSKESGLDIGKTCDFDWLEVDGAAECSVSHGRDSLVAQIDLQSLGRDLVDFHSHIDMIGSLTGACRTPG